MTANTQNSPENGFKMKQFQFFRNDAGQLVPLPSGDGLEGYLAYDSKEESFVQIRLLKAASPEQFESIKEVWSHIRSQNDSILCPEMLAHGEENSIPYYVSSLPAGEPVKTFVSNGGPIPTEIAVMMTLQFIDSLEAQNPILHEKYAISPSSLWVSNSTGQPRISFGDFSIETGHNAETRNAHLCKDLIKYLSGNPPFDEDFQHLCTSLDQCPQTVKSVADQLENYLASKELPNFWNETNQPNPILHQLVDPRETIHTASDATSEEVGLGSKTPSLWKSVVGVAAAAILLGIITSSALQIFSGKSSDTNAQAENQPKLEDNSSTKMNRSAESSSEPSAVVIANKTPTDFASENNPDVKQIDELDKAGASVTPPTDSSAKEKGFLLGKIGQLFAKKKKSSDEIKPELDTVEKANTMKALVESPKDPMPMPLADIQSKHTATLPPNSATASERVANAAARARENDQPINALKQEMIYLELEPDSRAARMRVKEDLLALEAKPHLSISQAEISTLEQAVAYDSKAYEILTRHYQDTNNFEKEISTLVRHARTGIPAKLAEAGQRIFQNPAATVSEKKKAREYFIEAAEQGDKDGQFFAGECLILGRGGEEDPTKGVEYLKLAVAQNDARAMDLLGVCYVRSWGVEPDKGKEETNDARAVKLFEAAIKNNNIPAYYNLGARYAQGQGVERNGAKAADLFEEGSIKGNAHCMLVLARCYEAGFGRDQDDLKASHWYKQSAEAGNQEAKQWCIDNDVKLEDDITGNDQ